jgi:hypothetical protein
MGSPRPARPIEGSDRLKPVLQLRDHTIEDPLKGRADAGGEGVHFGGQGFGAGGAEEVAVAGAAVMIFNWIVINFVISGLHSYA